MASDLRSLLSKPKASGFLILATEPTNAAAIASKLVALKIPETIEIFIYNLKHQNNSNSLNLDYLSQFSAVLVESAFNSFLSASTLSSLLFEFSNRGGGVVVCLNTFIMQIGSHLLGDFEKLMPFQFTPHVVPHLGVKKMITTKYHPIFAGVKKIEYSATIALCKLNNPTVKHTTQAGNRLSRELMVELDRKFIETEKKNKQDAKNLLLKHWNEDNRSSLNYIHKFKTNDEEDDVVEQYLSNVSPASMIASWSFANSSAEVVPAVAIRINVRTGKPVVGLNCFGNLGHLPSSDIAQLLYNALVYSTKITSFMQMTLYTTKQFRDVQIVSVVKK